jgi:hypothetical protein
MIPSGSMSPNQAPTADYWVDDTPVGALFGLMLPEGIIHPVVSCRSLIWAHATRGYHLPSKFLQLTTGWMIPSGSMSPNQALTADYWVDDTL